MSLDVDNCSAPMSQVIWTRCFTSCDCQQISVLLSEIMELPIHFYMLSFQCLPCIVITVSMSSFNRPYSNYVHTAYQTRYQQKAKKTTGMLVAENFKIRHNMQSDIFLAFIFFTPFTFELWYCGLWIYFVDDNAAVKLLLYCVVVHLAVISLSCWQNISFH